MTQRGPERTIKEIDLIEPQDSLSENRCDPRCAFHPGDSSKLFGSYARERNSGAFQSSHKLSGKGLNEELLAVEQRVYGEAMIDSFYEVANAFDEEEST